MQAVNGFRPVAINVGVRNIVEAIAFYEALFGVTLQTRVAEGRPVHARLRFGDHEFLFNIRERGPEDPHRGHISAFGFAVDNLEVAHGRAVAAGAREHFAPMDTEGLPRHSRIEDPSGNRIVLWQS